MKLEQAIKQRKPFVSDYQRAVVNLMYTSNCVYNRIKEVLKPFKITPQQYNVLRILKGADKPISTSEIRERLLDKMADTSRLVDRMEQKNWVVKQTCPNDKRLVDISISDKGDKLLSQINALIHDSNEQTLSLSEEEVKLLNDLLDKARG